jgi:hypothetical protein
MGGGGAWAGGGAHGRAGVVFVPGPGEEPKPTQVKLGLSDGRYVEVADGLSEGATVITAVEDARAPRPQPSASGTTNPFQPQRFQPRTR